MQRPVRFSGLCRPGFESTPPGCHRLSIPWRHARGRTDHAAVQGPSSQPRIRLLGVERGLHLDQLAFRVQLLVASVRVHRRCGSRGRARVGLVRSPDASTLAAAASPTTPVTRDASDTGNSLSLQIACIPPVSDLFTALPSIDPPSVTSVTDRENSNVLSRFGRDTPRDTRPLQSSSRVTCHRGRVTRQRKVTRRCDTWSCIHRFEFTRHRSLPSRHCRGDVHAFR
ncbi:hypothetical protein ACVWZK_007183 [Bradyrhizobium sp. GM0.4]